MQSAWSWPVLWLLASADLRLAGTAGTLRTCSWGYGAVVAHLPCMQGVRGSNPLSSTRKTPRQPLAGPAPAEFEYGPVAWAQLADVAGYSGSYLVAGALRRNLERQLVAVERDQDRSLPELYTE
jgi:hypothetical protein